MRAFKIISERYQRGIGLAVLLSYSALVLLLALHFHEHPAVPDHEMLQPMSTDAPVHGHTAAVCPLQYYLIFAFQAEPGSQQQTVIPASRRLAASTDRASCISISGTLFLTRAPPALT